MDYLPQIRTAKTPEEAALYIRAQAASNATSLTCYSCTDRLSIVTEAEERARTLERGWNEDSGPKPWRLWLKQWGYT
jgi:hypothetical protein